MSKDAGREIILELDLKSRRLKVLCDLIQECNHVGAHWKVILTKQAKPLQCCLERFSEGVEDYKLWARRHWWCALGLSVRLRVELA